MRLGDVLRATDWITPLLRLGEQARGMTVIELDDMADGLTGAQVKRALREAGVRHGFGMTFAGEHTITVDDPEAAERALRGRRR